MKNIIKVFSIIPASILCTGMFLYGMFSKAYETMDFRKWSKIEEKLNIERDSIFKKNYELQIRNSFDYFDYNQDGFISFEEFKEREGKNLETISPSHGFRNRGTPQQ